MQIGLGNNPQNNSCAGTGLILTGGGARAAYQVGVLNGIFEILGSENTDCSSPFSIISGTSAGAINAASLASNANDIHTGIQRLSHLWGSLRTEMVYACDSLSLFKTGAYWLGVLSMGWAFPSLRSRKPYSLLDNSPLRVLLDSTVDFDRINSNLQKGLIDALAITSAGYDTGEHLTFYQSNIPIKPWSRSARKAIPGTICVDHLMGSSAIPFIFPAEPILVRNQVYWCGDGSMRQLAPLSPAIHLGAEKIVVIGTAFKDEVYPENADSHSDYPSLAQIGGHVLSNIFLDSLSMDVERLDRINELLSAMPDEIMRKQSLRPVESLVIRPSKSLGEIALEHLSDLPKAARTLFKAVGVSPRPGKKTSGALISYLLFESGYTQELMLLGKQDCLNRIDEVKAFFKESLL